ncbi:MAG: DUF559 domain-containing protein [Chitinophagales bacterium]|nr:DUF559 domain-containing protein [Chitinophagales bacterium]
MRPNQMHNRTYLKQARRDLRNNLTPAEATLWQCLKNSQLLGRKFRRQHSIENYIVDFYCPTEKLVIELDGGIHLDAIVMENDLARDARLLQLGYRVLRFQNDMVFNCPEQVLEEIAKHFTT